MEKKTELERARERFKYDVYATEVTGIVIEAVADDYAKCSLRVTPSHKNAAGAVMGGVLFTLADFTFAVAANHNRPLTVTAVSQINYVGVCKGEMLFAESRLIKNGKRNCFFEITVCDDLGNTVAVVSACGTHLE